MANAPFGTMLRLIRRISALPNGDTTDACLLGRFAAERDEEAFAELVRRHGPMVLGTCRRLLGEPHAADDAFQATFLVLARRAGELDGRQPLGCWLYAVARNLACKQRLAATRRRAHEAEASAMRTPETGEPGDEAAWREVCSVLDAELERLPEKYRAPLVLCHLQGLSHTAAAQELGWPVGSMAKRLERGQELLRERLLGRGIALPAAALGTLIGEHASAAVSSIQIAQISHAAKVYALGELTAGLVSAEAGELANGSLATLATTRWKLVAALLLGLSAIGGGAIVFGHLSEKPKSAAEVPQSPNAAEEDPRDEEMRRKLARNIVLVQGIDPNTPLKEVLDYLTQRHELKIRLDTDAFAAAGVAVEDCKVSLPKVALPLGTVLRLVLRQVEPLDGRVSGYRIEQGTLVIAPLPLENQPERWPRWLPTQLLQKVRCDREPYGMPLGEALEIYGKVWGLKLIFDRKAFADVGEPRADQYPLAGWGRELTEDPSLLEVLEVILWQVDGRTWKSYLHVRENVIEITAAAHESDRAKMLAAHSNTLYEYRDLWMEKPRLEPKLRAKVHLEKGIDDGTPLKDMLEFLSDRYDLAFLMDERAFAAAGIQNVGERTGRLDAQIGVPLETVLRRFLDQIQNEEFTAGFAYRDSYIEIVPEHNQLRQQKPLQSRHLDRLWKNLGQSEGHARLAIRTLAGAPREALPYLKERLQQPVQKERNLAARIAKLVADLESNQFDMRERASAELEKLGSDAVPALRQRVKDDPPLDARVRIELILKRVDDWPERENLRPCRAVRVLEAIGTAEARQLLKKLADGETDALLTGAARAALDRLAP